MSRERNEVDRNTRAQHNQDRLCAMGIGHAWGPWINIASGTPPLAVSAGADTPAPTLKLRFHSKRHCQNCGKVERKGELCPACGSLAHENCGAPVFHTDEPEHWSHGGADYDGNDCENCGRNRVLLYDNGRRICEKCNWDQVLDEYAFDHQRIG